MRRTSDRESSDDIETLLQVLQARVTGVQPGAVLEHHNRLPLTVKSELPDTVPIDQS